MKRLEESVPRQLREILNTHGQSSLTDARLCENLLKDYCGEYKEEISLLVLGVKERIPIDLLVSQDAVESEVLRGLLVSRLRRNSQLNEGEARWVVDSWSFAVSTLAPADLPGRLGGYAATTPDAPNDSTASEHWAFGIVAQSGSAVRSIAFSPLSDLIAFAGDDGAVRSVDVRTGATSILEDCGGPVSAVRFSPTGVLLATVSHEGGADKSLVRIRDLQSNESLDLGEVGLQSPSLAFSSGGTRLACSSAEPDGMIRVWNLQSGQSQNLRGSCGPCSISFSPDGKFIAAADATRTDAVIRLWNLDTGAAEILGSCRRRISSVAFAPNGRQVASGSWDEEVRLWDVRTRKATVLGAGCSCICCIAFSLQGDKLGACALDSRIRIWSLADGRCHTVGLCDNVNDLAFSSDGAALATASGDGTVRLWDAHV
ncbi:MAG TPA: WD40 repeat domain-containing protein [Pyrinomonadaceae bacterium]|nr:WD40 repeat domain-containing protein [Pyrinomonadaceae bacterium]